MSDAIERQMDAQGIEKAHLVGNSQGGWQGSREERAVIRSFRRARLALRLSRPWFETIARHPRMRAIAFAEMCARPSRLSA